MRGRDANAEGPKAYLHHISSQCDQVGLNVLARLAPHQHNSVGKGAWADGPIAPPQILFQLQLMIRYDSTSGIRKHTREHSVPAEENHNNRRYLAVRNATELGKYSAVYESDGEENRGRYVT